MTLEISGMTRSCTGDLPRLSSLPARWHSAVCHCLPPPPCTMHAGIFGPENFTASYNWTTDGLMANAGEQHFSSTWCCASPTPPPGTPNSSPSLCTPCNSLHQPHLWFGSKHQL